MDVKFRIRVRFSDGEETVFPFDKREMVVGRGKNCAITIADPGVALHHARLTMVSQDNVVVDSPGDGGDIRINDQLIPGKTRILPGMTIRIGDAYLALESTGDENLKGFKYPDETIDKYTFIFEDVFKERPGDMEQLLMLIGDALSSRSASLQVEKFLSRIAWILNGENGLILRRTQSHRQTLAARLTRKKKLFYPTNIMDTILAAPGACLLDFSGKNLKAVATKTGIGSAICATIHDGDRVWGAIYLDRGANRKKYKQTDLDLLVRLANLLGLIFRMEREYDRVAAEKAGLQTEKENWAGFKRENTELAVKSNNRKYQQLLFKALRVAGTNQPVFLHGEIGTGRLILAKRIHQSSSRSDQPFVRMDCTAVPRTIIDRELFGYENPDDDALDPSIRGYLETAHGGTLYLQEISVLPISTQKRLAAVLETGMMTRVRGRAPFGVDIRLVVCSDVDIENLRQTEKIVPELHEQLKKAILRIPSLKQRVEDILPLARFFLRHFLPKNRAVPTFSSEVVELLQRYTWPGNIQELTHAMRYVAATCIDQRIELGDLPRSILEQPTEIPRDDQGFREQMDHFEITLIQRALEANKYIVTRAAKSLGLSESTLRYRMQRLGIAQGD